MENHARSNKLISQLMQNLTLYSENNDNFQSTNDYITKCPKKKKEISISNEIHACRNFHSNRIIIFNEVVLLEEAAKHLSCIFPKGKGRRKK